ncbi:MAG TPA: hypothetical protein PK186_01600 [candidate division Zixibacteria bacterium]|nr:hypothetical protein [candidate division Zixibacteria bacterium]MDD4917062.1 hypothetical protein [candidate division Zixibacteria bacterium]MDM7972956.1 hypothetical protein [candidate division Zixibacteria bacterium]HOD65288.1 hypothetical protein [candidate division Zixibacteria bacterium]HPM36231.1 hypothetical protein [candidate division Zixibacteria bacterium]
MLRAPFPCIFLAVALGLVLAACQSDKKETSPSAADDPYAGWKTYTNGTLRVHYPEGHPMAAHVEEMAHVFPALMRRDAQFFQVPVPTDTIEVYFYTGVGHGHKITGTYYPYADTSVIHFWLPSNYGPIMAQLMLKRWYPGEPKFRFLKHGVRALLEFAGVNYHQRTQELIDSGKFVSLAELAADTASDDYPDTESEQIRRALGASFVDFLVVHEGIRAFGMMYSSPLPFDSTVQRMFSVSADSLQQLWLNFVPLGAHPEELGRLPREAPPAVP